MISVEVKNESSYPLEYATDGSIGIDLRVVLGDGNHRYIQPGQRFKFDTGISIALPDGYGALITEVDELSLTDRGQGGFGSTGR